jgi:EmrB/QacA subfamily drug resistance transporter
MRTKESRMKNRPANSVPDAALEQHQNPHHGRRWLILAVLGLSQLMVVLDATVMNIALPTAQHALAFSDADRQWIVTGYALAFGSLLLLGGRLSDFLGRKWALMIGLGGFAAASVIGGFSTSFTMLLGARIFQGIFGALLAPAALSLLTTTFTNPEERGKAFGIYGAIAGAGGAIGLLLGGVLTSYASWRWNLLVNVPIGVVTIAGAALLLHHSRAATRARLDLPGVATVTVGLSALVYGLSHAETTSWTNTATLSFLAAAVVLLVSFVVVETRVKHPLLPVRLVLNRHRGGSLLSMFFSGVGMFAFFFFLTFYLQGTLGYTPVRTGIAFLAMVATLVVSAQISTNLLLHRLGPRLVVASGMLIAAAAMLLFTRIGPQSSYATVILPALLVLGVGFGLVMPAATSTAVFGVEARDAGVASAMVTTVQQVGGSIGTALLSTLAARAATSFAAGHPGTGNLQVLATIHGYVTVFYYSALVFAVGAVAAWLLIGRGVPAGLARLKVTPEMQTSTESS